jgi:hypothetical protein
MSYPLTIANTPRWNVIDKTGIFMYVSSNDTTTGVGYISKINLITKSVVYSWASISLPVTGDTNVGIRGLAIDNTNTYLYAVLRTTVNTSAIIYRVNLIGSPTATAWMTGGVSNQLSSMRGIAIDPNGIFMYVSRGTTITRITIATTGITNTWANVVGSTTFQGLAIDNNNTYLY